ncbi:MAG: C39 family peptidase [Chloroflexi bacterium]|nr:C39 family peptidase [Chloroflexota bacterium]
MNTRQIVLLEILFLANLAVFASLGVIALGEGWIQMPGALSHNNPDTVLIVVMRATESALPALTVSPTLLPTFALLPARTLIPTNTPTPVSLGRLPQPTSAPTANAQGVLLDIIGHPQSLPLSCESRSAADWAGYFGAAIDELEFFGRLPVSDNPDVGFAGDVNGKWGNIPPNAYGVHAGPVAALLQDYGLSAEARRDLTWDNLRAELDAGRPVMVWVTGHVSSGAAVEYVATDGQTVVVAPFEHTVIVVGYTTDSVSVLDGSRIYLRSLEKFLDSWAVLGNMAIVAGP